MIVAVTLQGQLVNARSDGNSSFAAFPESESDDGRLNVWLPRALYCLIHLGGLAFALWKINGMGLLPTHASDYVSAMTVPKAQFLSLPGVSL